MLLDLFVTHYNEPWEVGSKGFHMLACQRLVDWSQIRITLVHDGTKKFPKRYFKDYPFTVNQVVIPHGGIAAARNWCIEHSQATWIKWNDFDDTFYSAYSLYHIMNVLNNDSYDLLWFNLLVEDQKGRNYLRTERNPVFIHDKVFRRQFLLNHHIMYNTELIWCEDSAFLSIVEMEINHQRIGKIKTDVPIYLYICRDGSLCNRPEIRFANLQSFFKRHCYVADEFLKRNLIDQYNTMCVRVMADSYYTLHKAPDIPDGKEKIAHEARVWKWFDEHREPYHACRPEMFDMVMEAVNRECFDGGVITKQEVTEWIDKHERGE